MRKTKMSICISGSDREVARTLLAVLGRYEAVQPLSSGRINREVLMKVHSCNKSAAFMLPYHFAENLSHQFIRINAFPDGQNLAELSDRYENIVLVNPDNLAHMQQQIEAIAAKYEMDIGDYIPENLQVEQPTEDNCLLCRIYNDNVAARTSADKHLPIMNTILYESPNFYVVPAKGALTEGYVMLVPKLHVWSFAGLNQELWEEAKQVLADVKWLLGRVFKTEDFVIFEHGSGLQGQCKHAKSIVHAHLHILPFQLTLKPNLRRDFRLRDISVDELHNYVERPYLLYSDKEGEWAISADPKVYIPRQCIRQVIGDEINLTGTLWNWRNHSFHDKIYSTVGQFSRYLAGHWMEVPDRIMDRVRVFLDITNHEDLSDLSKHPPDQEE